MNARAAARAPDSDHSSQSDARDGSPRAGSVRRLAPWIQRQAACACGGACPRCTGTADHVDAGSSASILPLIQRTPDAGGADDRYEREANDVAAHVTGTVMPRLAGST